MAKRGRPKGSKNQAKNGAAPAAVGSKPGHNIQDIDDEHREALTRQHLEKRKKLLEAEKTARADRMNLDKVIKSDLGPKGLSDIKLLNQLETPEGEADLQAELERMVRVARWSGTGIQLDLTLSPPSSVDRARQEARRDANSGQPCKTDYAPVSAEYDAYMDSWHKTTAERNTAISNAVNGDAGDAAAESFEDSVESAEIAADRQPPDMPAELVREPA